MLSKRINEKFIGTCFLMYVAFVWIAPSLRIALFGTAASTGIADSLVTLLPDILLIVFFALTVFYFFSRDRKAFHLTFFDKVFFFFWITNVILGFILAHAFRLSLLGFRITYLPMIFYASGRMLVPSKIPMGRIINGLIYITAFFCIVGIVIYFCWPNLSADIAVASGHESGKYFITRMTSILWTPVLFGTVVLIPLCYCTYKILVSGNRIGWIFFILFWFCLFMTVSRGPVIAFLIAFITLVIITREWKRGIAVFVLMFIISGSVSYVAVGDLHMLKWMFKSTGETLALDEGVTRVDRWQETWNDFKARPYGYGLGKAGAVAFRYLVNSDVPSAPYSTDGWILKLACETGIYGVITFLFFCCVYFFRFVRQLMKRRKGTHIVIFALFLAVNAQALISNVYDFYPYIGIFWMLMGLTESELEEAP
jgi:hypothetical protein